MDDKLRFRRVTTGDEIEVAVALTDDAGPPAGEYLTARYVELSDGTKLRQHRVRQGADRSEGYTRLDNEILAGRLLYNTAGASAYPSEVARLYGDKATSADPYTLFEPYRGKPVRDAAERMLDEEQEAFQLSLLTGFCWLASAGIAHRAISPDTVLCDRRSIQITDFSKATVFGASRTPVSGTLDWVAREQREGQAFGAVGPRDDIWAAGRLIFFVHNLGEDRFGNEQIAQSSLAGLLAGIIGPPEGRPTASQLLERKGRYSIVPSAPGNGLLREGRRRFWAVRGRKHPDAPVPVESAEYSDDPPFATDPAHQITPPTGSGKPATPGDTVPSNASVYAVSGGHAGSGSRDTGRRWGWRRRGAR